MLGDSDEKRLLELAREIKKLDKEMVKRFVEGKNYGRLEERFLDLKKEIVEIVSRSDDPIKLYDPEATRTLRKLREGKLSFVEKLHEKFMKLFDAWYNGKLKLNEDSELHRILKEILKESDGKDIDFEDDFSERFSELVEIIDTEIGIDFFFENKKKFSSLFVTSPLPEEFGRIFYQIRWCYILNLSDAVIGLCRTLIEIAYRDKYRKYFSVQRRGNNVSELSEKHITLEHIRNVSKRLGLGDRGKDLYELASDYFYMVNLENRLIP